MRIISGELKGRIFESPRLGRTHPMSEKVRGAIFNSLGDIDGLNVIDFYAGSGALGFEALSRGAASLVAVELDKQVTRVIKNNAKILGLDDKSQIIQMAAKSWSKKNEMRKFDIIFCDPPYDAISETEIAGLSQHLKQRGVMVLSWPVKLNSPKIKYLEKLSEKEYAGAKTIFYRSSGKV